MTLQGWLVNVPTGLNSLVLAPSSSGLGHHPLKVETRVRTPLGLPQKRQFRGKVARFRGALAIILPISSPLCPPVLVASRRLDRGLGRIVLPLVPVSGDR